MSYNLFTSINRSLLLALMLISLPMQADVADPANHEMDHSHETDTYGMPGEQSSVSQTVTITARDILFSPLSIDLQRGQTVKFIITNSGRLPHEFVLGTEEDQARHNADMKLLSDDEVAQHMANEKNGILIQPGETRELAWTFTTELEQVQFACHIPGHYEAGMHGSIFIQDITD